MQVDVLESMQFLTSISAETTGTKNLEKILRTVYTQPNYGSRTANKIKILFLHVTLL